MCWWTQPVLRKVLCLPVGEIERRFKRQIAVKDAVYKRQATTFFPCPPLELFSKMLLFIVPPNYEMGFSPLAKVSH